MATNLAVGLSFIYHATLLNINQDSESIEVLRVISRSGGVCNHLSVGEQSPSSLLFLTQGRGFDSPDLPFCLYFAHMFSLLHRATTAFSMNALVSRILLSCCKVNTHAQYLRCRWRTNLLGYLWMMDEMET